MPSNQQVFSLEDLGDLVDDDLTDSEASDSDSEGDQAEQMTDHDSLSNLIETEWEDGTDYPTQAQRDLVNSQRNWQQNLDPTECQKGLEKFRALAGAEAPECERILNGLVDEQIDRSTFLREKGQLLSSVNYFITNNSKQLISQHVTRSFRTPGQVKYVVKKAKWRAERRKGQLIQDVQPKNFLPRIVVGKSYRPAIYRKIGRMRRQKGKNTILNVSKMRKKNQLDDAVTMIPSNNPTANSYTFRRAQEGEPMLDDLMNSLAQPSSGKKRSREAEQDDETQEERTIKKLKRENDGELIASYTGLAASKTGGSGRKESHRRYGVNYLGKPYTSSIAWFGDALSPHDPPTKHQAESPEYEMYSMLNPMRTDSLGSIEFQEGMMTALNEDCTSETMLEYCQSRGLDFPVRCEGEMVGVNRALPTQKGKGNHLEDTLDRLDSCLSPIGLPLGKRTYPNLSHPTIGPRHGLRNLFLKVSPTAQPLGWQSGGDKKKQFNIRVQKRENIGDKLVGEYVLVDKPRKTGQEKQPVGTAQVLPLSTFSQDPKYLTAALEFFANSLVSKLVQLGDEGMKRIVGLGLSKEEALEIDAQIRKYDEQEVRRSAQGKHYGSKEQAHSMLEDANAATVSLLWATHIGSFRSPRLSIFSSVPTFFVKLTPLAITKVEKELQERGLQPEFNQDVLGTPIATLEDESRNTWRFGFRNLPGFTIKMNDKLISSSDRDRQEYRHSLKQMLNLVKADSTGSDDDEGA
ncbi:hypothetical protein JCM5350_008090 [Sporobolomyces pararoseus]